MTALKSISVSFLFSVYFLFAINLNAWGFSAQKIAQTTFPSIVLLIMEDLNNQPVSLGSGFFVKDGIVATNFHVIDNSSGGFAKIVGKREKFYIGGTVGMDQKVDLILLSLQGMKGPPLQLGDSKKVQIGDEIYAVGNPLGLEGIFSKGIISGIRKIGSESLFQITAPISPGSSGGPVLNTKGQVIGISVATYESGQNLNFAIPVNYLKALLGKMSAIQPIKNLAAKKNRKSITSSIGNPNKKGVTARAFKWNINWYEQSDGVTSDYSFSIYNMLRNPITNVNCLAIFYDNKMIPIHAEHVFFGYNNSDDDIFEEILGFTWKEALNSNKYKAFSAENKLLFKAIVEQEYRDNILKAKKVIPGGLAKIVNRRGIPKGTQEQTNTVKMRVLDFKILAR